MPNHVICAQAGIDAAADDLKEVNPGHVLKIHNYNLSMKESRV